VLTITASNTVGTPIHQDEATPPVRTNQIRRNSTPRDTIVNHLVLTLIVSIYQNLVERISLTNAGGYYI